jgi:lipopolysaccharide biosynthesis glycosyltransferase
MALSSKPLPAVILCHEVPSDSMEVAKTYVGGDSTFVDASAQLRGLNLSVAPHITKAAYLRLFVDLVPELAQFSKLLYVDCDVEFLKDPCQLAGVELTAAPILATYDMRFLSSGGHRAYLPMAHDSPYFNSGVLVLDLDRIRREGQLDRARRFASDFPDLCINHDQDALNVGFSEGWQTMDWRWNTVSMFQDRLPHDRFFVRHFSGHKPWGRHKAGIEPTFVSAWRRSLGDSPWPEKFLEMNATERFRAALRPTGNRLEMGVKNAIYGGVLGRTNAARARRVQLASNFKTVLSRIEDDATHGRLARRTPEHSLID